MTLSGPGSNIFDIPLSPPKTGLIPSSQAFYGIVDDEAAATLRYTDGELPVERWGGGVYADPDGGLDGTTTVVCDGVDYVAPVRPDPEDPWFPYEVMAGVYCSTWQNNYTPWYERSVRKLLAFEQYHIERQLYSDPLGVGNFTIEGNGTLLSATALTPFKALARLEQEMSTQFPAGRFMIHMRPFVLSLILGSSSNQLTQQGNIWLSPMGNIVVPARGFSGAGPAAAPAPSASIEYIYATAPVWTQRGVITNVLDDVITVNRQTNDRTVYAKRLAIAGFDHANVPILASKVDIS